MQLGAGKAMHTLDLRESRSSLAGVMMAAAMEGMGFYEFSKHVVPHIDDLPARSATCSAASTCRRCRAAGRWRARRRRARRRGRRTEAEAPAAAPRDGAAPAPPAARGGRTRRRRPEAAGRRSGAEQEPAAARGGRASAPKAADAPEAATRGRGGAARTATRRPPSRPRGAARSCPRARSSLDGVGGAVAAPARGAGAPDGAGCPRAGRAGGAGAAGADRSGPVGQDGTGRAAGRRRRWRCSRTRTSCSTTSAWPTSRPAGSTRGSSAVLTKLSQEHKITVSCMCSDHSKFTSAARSPTTPTGAAWTSPRSTARSSARLARSPRGRLRALRPRSGDPPDEIGSPFAINGPGYFTDAAHMNHVHVGFKQAITPDYQAPRRSCAPAAARRPLPRAPVADTPLPPARWRTRGGRPPAGGSLGAARCRSRRPPARGPRSWAMTAQVESSSTAAQRRATRGARRS